MSNPECPATAILHGEFLNCDWPTDEDGRHDGWAHTNMTVGLVWVGADEAAAVSAAARREQT